MSDQILPNIKLFDLMLNTFSCENFGKCGEFSYFKPNLGLVPRGFVGATGELSKVKIVMLLAEPGHPHESEAYLDNVSKREILVRSISYTYECYKNKKDQLHKNVRSFIDHIFPDMSFDEQLKHVWITEGRLCSIKNEIGQHNDKFCSKLHLANQIDLLPNAIIIPFGGKARDRLSQIDTIKNEVIKSVNIPENVNIYALAPPGANRKLAKPSWIATANEVLPKLKS